MKRYLLFLSVISFVFFISLRFVMAMDQQTYKELKEGILTESVQNELKESINDILQNLNEDDDKTNRLRSVNFNNGVITVEWNLQVYVSSSFTQSVYKNEEELDEKTKERTSRRGMTDLRFLFNAFGYNYKLLYDTELKYEKVIFKGYFNNEIYIYGEFDRKFVDAVRGDVDEIEIFNMIKKEGKNVKLISPFDTTPDW